MPRKLINRDQFARVRASFEVVNFQFEANNKIPVSQPQSKYNTRDLQSGNKYSKFPPLFFYFRISLSSIKNVRINAAFSGELLRFQLGPERTRNFQPFSTAVQRYPK